MALGASTGNVVGLVMSGGGRVVALGVVIGLASAAVLSQSILAFLFGVEPLDPLTFASVAFVVVVTAAVAMASPAIRATQVDPVVAFRNE
jgi:putative ABC transport system permease protein